MQQTQVKENKMGVMPIPKLLISMSLPIMLSMLVQALYNIVDSIFVSRIDEYALTAVSLAFPVQNLMTAVASGTCVGINALLSRSLGAKNERDASLAANNGIFLGILSYIVFALMGIFGSRFFFAVQIKKRPRHLLSNTVRSTSPSFSPARSAFLCSLPSSVSCRRPEKPFTP